MAVAIRLRARCSVGRFAQNESSAGARIGVWSITQASRGAVLCSGSETRALHGQLRLIGSITGLAALVSFVAATADAQTRRWYGPYQVGRGAIDDAEWNIAIASLRTAASIESRCESGKVIEGVIRDDYCPDLYLARADIGTGGQQGMPAFHVPAAAAARLDLHVEPPDDRSSLEIAI